MTGQRIAYLLSQGQPGENAEVKGWVRTRRDSKQGFSFVELNDGSCMKNLQIVIDNSVGVGRWEGRFGQTAQNSNSVRGSSDAAKA